MRCTFPLLWLVLAGTTLASSPAQAVSTAYADALRLGTAGLKEDDLQAYRYFWVSTPKGKERDTFRAAFKLHLNLLSRYSEPVDVIAVAPDVWRVDMDEVKWDKATLEAARFVDVFFHERRVLKEDTVFRTYWPGGVDSREGKFFKAGVYREKIEAGKEVALSASWLPVKDIVALREVLYTECPVLCAEWFLVQSSRQISIRNQANEGLGYYDFLRVKDRNGYFDLLAFDEKAADRFGREIRAVASLSGVSPAPRQLVRLGLGGGGAAWVALDTNNPTGKGIALSNLEKGQFKHQIEEWYGFLPNGLPATFLSDDKGVRQNNAPADAAGFRDDSRLNEGKDGRIHVNLACLRCHAGQVLLPIDDHVRKVFRAPINLGVKDKERLLALRRQYFSDLDRTLERDRKDYQDAFTVATVTSAFPAGLTAQKAVEAYARAFHAYADDPVTVEKAALELGAPLETWRSALTYSLKEVKLLDLRLSPFVATPPVTINRLTWEDGYREAQDTLARFVAVKGVKR